MFNTLFERFSLIVIITITPIVIVCLNNINNFNNKFSKKIENNDYKHLEGYINDKKFNLELLLLSNNSSMPLVGYYYQSDSCPIFLEGRFLDSFTVSKKISIKSDKITDVKTDTVKNIYSIELTDFYTNKCGKKSAEFFGNFISPNVFRGFYSECSNKNQAFEFKEDNSSQDSSMAFERVSYANSFKCANKSQKDNCFLNIEALYPTKTGYNDNFIAEQLYKIILKDKNIKIDINKTLAENIKPNVKFFFKEDKEILEKSPKEESYRDIIICPVFNSKKLLSIVKINKFDVARNHGCYTQGYSFSIKKKCAIKFNQVFLPNTQKSLLQLIKKSNSDKNQLNIMDSILTNFYLTNSGIVFIHFGFEESHNEVLSGKQFYFSYESIKKFLKDDFIEMIR